MTAAYRIVHTKYPGPTLGVGAGLRWRHEGRAKQFGATLGSSGSDTLWIHARSVFHPRPQWDMVLGVDVPIYGDYNGVQLDDEIRIGLSVGLRF